MSLNKKIFLIFFLFLFSLSLIILPAKAADVGCCEKKNSKTGVVMNPTNLTEENCKKINTDNADITINWKSGQEVIGNVCQTINKTPSKTGDLTTYTPQVDIPNSTFIAGQTITIKDNTSLLADYIIAIFKYAIGIIGIISAIVLMFAGLRWLTAGGNSTAIGEAKTFIASSLTGLILTLCSFLFLSTINTKLTNLNIPAVTRIQYVPIDSGCCLKTDKQDKNKVTADSTTEVACSKIDYATTEFFKDYVAFENACVPNKGCCIVSVYTVNNNMRSLEKRLCYENKTKATCGDKSSNWFKLLISGPLGIGREYDAYFAAPLTCKEDVATIKADACSEIVPE